MALELQAHFQRAFSSPLIQRGCCWLCHAEQRLVLEQSHRTQGAASDGGHADVPASFPLCSGKHPGQTPKCLSCHSCSDAHGHLHLLPVRHLLPGLAPEDGQDLGAGSYSPGSSPTETKAALQP